jgi:hypothetical protein
MKHIRLYESFENYVGIHCSPKDINDSFHGSILDEYYMTFHSILTLIQKDYKGASDLIQQIDDLDGELSMVNDSIDLIFDIVDFFQDNNIEWIFVAEEPMTKYGDNCYQVYFKDLSNVYFMDDELTDGAKIYIYNSKTDAPSLVSLND